MATINANLGRLATERSIDSAIVEIKKWLGYLGIERYDVNAAYDPRLNVAVLDFKYKNKPYEFRSTKQKNCRLNMHAISRVMEAKVRAEIMQIEDFETSMSPYLALPGTGPGPQGASPQQDPSAYVVFGISPLASNDELRACYKRLMKAYHPDMLAGINSPEAREAFEKKAQEINDAWSKIKAERGIA